MRYDTITGTADGLLDIALHQYHNGSTEAARDTAVIALALFVSAISKKNQAAGDNGLLVQFDDQEILQEVKRRQLIPDSYLLTLCRQFDRIMADANSNPEFAHFWANMPPGMLTLWNDTAETITALTGEDR